MASIPILLEVGSKKVFACALEWPGWCRAAKSEEAAIEALSAYAPRYAPVAAEARFRFPPSAGQSLEVVERVKGSATTDFGAPDKAGAADAEPLTKAAAARLGALVEASWTMFDAVVAGAPASLRKGPRGGGRDRDKMVDHVLGSEASYARQIGVRHPQPAAADTAAVAALRADILAALRSARAGEPLREKGWLPRYAARRIAWHVLDHAWEMEDRSG